MDLDRIRVATNEIRNVHPSFLGDTTKAFEYIKTLPMYAQTPLISLDNLAAQVGIGKLLVKDESNRFGLKSFKPIGSVFAVSTLLSELVSGCEPHFFDSLEENLLDFANKPVFATASDGNHGYGLAWAANIFGCKSTVFLPAGTVESRISAIDSIPNGKAVLTTVGYDETVNHAKEYAQSSGAVLVQDTSFEGYEDVPKLIMQGYCAIACEITEQIEILQVMPTHVFLQAGVGSFAAAVLLGLKSFFEAKARPMPEFAIVEPLSAACLFESAISACKEIVSVVEEETIMAGLKCGTPSRHAWEVLKDCARYFIACPDSVSAHGMWVLAHPAGEDARIVSGESGSVGAGLVSALRHPSCAGIKETLGLGKDSVVLVINTEGDTDPSNYHQIINDISNKQFNMLGI
ncbi:MAG: diaminopropionate ammonia-lyase [Eubacteriaceae bacterium]|nr:diaminopropionate ammonia-lyase [Eubacteriaceae bacterium]